MGMVRSILRRLLVSGPPACNPQSGCPGDPPGLPRFGVDRQGPVPCPVSVSTGDSAQSGLPTENALPGCARVQCVWCTLHTTAYWSHQPPV